MSNGKSILRLRPADLGRERAALVELFRLYLSTDFTEKRFNWLYCNNPFGPARAWVLSVEASEGIVGAGAIFPRLMYVDGIERIGCVLADFCVAAEYRSLGPSLKLQRALVTASQEDPFTFFYDFPSRSMLAVYGRIGIAQSGQIVRWAKLLRADQKLAAMLPNKSLAHAAAVLANPLLSLRRQSPRRGRYDIRRHEGRCGDEFTQFDRQFQTCPGIRTVRNAAYLNWRYLDSPERAYTILTARRQNELKGYVVITAGAEEGAIVDLSSGDDPDLIGPLLDAATEHIRNSGAFVTVLNAVEGHPWSAEFQQAGFRRRDCSPLIVSVKPTAGIDENAFASRWYGMRGERDS